MLATSVLQSLTGIQFTFAGQRVGSAIVNRTRLALALFYLSVAHLLLHGQWWPLGAGGERWFWLRPSGIVGLASGSAAPRP